MTSLMARKNRTQKMSDHLRNSPCADLLREGDIIFWDGEDRTVIDVQDDPDIALNLRVKIDGLPSRILIPRSRLPMILVSRYEDRISDRVAVLREREVRLIRDIHMMGSRGSPDGVIIVELRRCLDTVRRELKRKKARKAFEPIDSDVIDL